MNPSDNVAAGFGASAVDRALELLPDPVMVVQAGLGPAAEVLFANAAARTHFRLAAAGQVLGVAVRDPRVLAAVEDAGRTGEAQETAFESIGVQPRCWRAFIRPLDAATLVIALRDETDARRTERMRADFLANASHELRTPLASLAGFIETLQTHARDDPEARGRFLDIMSQQAGRMTRLIDDLLSLSRIELNEHIAPEGRVDLGQVVSDVMDAIRLICADRAVNVTLGRPDIPAVAVGDRDQIVQVVQNLLDNAVKYSPRGADVRVEIFTAASLDAARGARRPGAVALPLLAPDPAGEGQAYVVVRVADDGAGIARQDLPRLSERFYRVEGQRGGGTGLGLAIVKHIVNRHRGGLTVESAEGVGTTFSVYLPAAS